jgi:hypothetical protein
VWGGGVGLRKLSSPAVTYANLWPISLSLSLFWLTTFCVLQWFFLLILSHYADCDTFHSKPACCQIACHHRWWDTTQPTSSGNPAAIPTPFHFPPFLWHRDSQMLRVIKTRKMRETQRGRGGKEYEKLTAWRKFWQRNLNKLCGMSTEYIYGSRLYLVLMTLWLINLFVNQSRRHEDVSA